MNISPSPFPLANSFGLMGRVQPSRPASVCSLPTLRLNLMLTHGNPPDFRGGVYLFIPSYVIGPAPSFIGSCNYVPMAFTAKSPPAQGQPVILIHTNSRCGKERRILIGPRRCKGSTRYWNYLEVYWPCAGWLSAVNAIGTHLLDPINSGLTRWRMAV